MDKYPCSYTVPADAGLKPYFIGTFVLRGNGGDRFRPDQRY